MEERIKDSQEDLEKAVRETCLFYLNDLLPGIRSGSFTDVDSVFDALEKYRQEHEAETNFAELFAVVVISTTEAIKEYKAGKTPKNFVEIVSAFSLVREAINDERLFSEPGITGLAVEQLRQYAIKANKIESDLAKYRGGRH